MGALKLVETYTYDDYKTWEGKWELIHGQAISMSPSPYLDHQRVERDFLIEIINNIDFDTCQVCDVVCEVDWKISDKTTVQPDIVMVCNNDDKFITKRPEIIVEVSSKSTAKRDETDKFELYEDEKVPYYILAYPKEKKIKIFEFDKKKNKYKSLGSYRDEKFTFKNIKCKDITINVKNIFKRLK